MAATVDNSFLECARTKRQVMDIAFPASLLIEKGLDIKSNLCLAQADVKQYYDHLRPLVLARWMQTNGFDPALSSTFLRLHLCPQLLLKVGEEFASIPHRCIGTLTGSRSASAAGRIPLLDAAINRMNHWKHLCFEADGHHFGLATFVDNLLTTGKTPETATALLDDCEAYLT